jgi:hypothetical protein
MCLSFILSKRDSEEYDPEVLISFASTQAQIWERNALCIDLFTDAVFDQKIIFIIIRLQQVFVHAKKSTNILRGLLVNCIHISVLPIYLFRQKHDQRRRT